MQDPLAIALLEGDLRDGDTIQADGQDGAIVFRAVQPAAAPA